MNFTFFLRRLRHPKECINWKNPSAAKLSSPRHFDDGSRQFQWARRWSRVGGVGGEGGGVRAYHRLSVYKSVGLIYRYTHK